MEIILTPQTEALLRARGITQEDLLFAFKNYTSSVPSKGFRGDRKLCAPLGRGRIFVVYAEQGENSFLVREAWRER